MFPDKSNSLDNLRLVCYFVLFTRNTTFYNKDRKLSIKFLHIINGLCTSPSKVSQSQLVLDVCQEVDVGDRSRTSVTETFIKSFISINFTFFSENPRLLKLIT